MLLEKKAYCDRRAAEIVSRIINDNMSEEEKIAACFQYTVETFRFAAYPTGPIYVDEDWVYFYAYKMLEPGRSGCCFCFAAVFSLLVGRSGVEEVYACNEYTHAWTEIHGLVYDAEQYRDSKYKIYAWEYSNPKISQFLPGIRTWKENPWMRIHITEDGYQ